MRKTYSKYKSSGVEWIGEIPENWDFIRLKHEYKIQKGKIPKIIFEEHKEDHVPYLSMDVIRGSQTIGYVHNEDGVYVYKGQVLILWDGSNSGEIFKVEKEGILSSTMGVLNKIGNQLNEDFSFYQLKSFEPEIRNNTNGMGIPHVDGSYVRSLPLFVPPLTEQEQIVKYLDEKTTQIDNLISITEDKIDLLKQKRTSQINQVITKGLNKEVKLKDSGVEWIGKIPNHWDRVCVKRLVSTKLCDGPHITPNFIDTGVPFISVESIKDDKIDFDFLRGYISKEDDIEFSKKTKPEKDDILLVKSGSTTGKVTIVETDIDFNIWSPLCLIRTKKEKVLPRFVFLSMKSDFFQITIQQSWSFGTQPNIGMGVIENLFLVIPPIKEQKDIISFIDKENKKIDNLISIEKRRVETLKEYRQSLISEVITGKIKVID